MGRAGALPTRVRVGLRGFLVAGDFNFISSLPLGGGARVRQLGRRVGLCGVSAICSGSDCVGGGGIGIGIGVGIGIGIGIGVSTIRRTLAPKRVEVDDLISEPLFQVGIHGSKTIPLLSKSVVVNGLSD